jgi:hypothetical protein
VVIEQESQHVRAVAGAGRDRAAQAEDGELEGACDRRHMGKVEEGDSANDGDGGSSEIQKQIESRRRRGGRRGHGGGKGTKEVGHDGQDRGDVKGKAHLTGDRAARQTPNRDALDRDLSRRLLDSTITGVGCSAGVPRASVS